MAETGGDFLLMKVRFPSFPHPVQPSQRHNQHEDVHRLVYRLAVESGAKVDFGVSVKSVTPGNPKPTVTLSTGEVLQADIVIGADGPRSFVRSVVLDRPDDPVPSGFTIFGTTISAEEMMKDPELAQLVQANEVGPAFF